MTIMTMRRAMFRGDAQGERRLPHCRSDRIVMMRAVASRVFSMRIPFLRSAGDGHLILDRSRLLLGDLSLQEIANDARRFVLTLDPGRHHLVVGGAHAIKLQLTH